MCASASLIDCAVTVRAFVQNEFFRINPVF
jgi:hypothetical protein